MLLSKNNTHKKSAGLFLTLFTHSLSSNVGKYCYTRLSTIYRHQGISAGQLTLSHYVKLLVTTIDAQWEGMGDVGSARYEPALLPPCPTITVLSYSN